MADKVPWIKRQPRFADEEMDGAKPYRPYVWVPATGLGGPPKGQASGQALGLSDSQDTAALKAHHLTVETTS